MKTFLIGIIIIIISSFAYAKQSLPEGSVLIQEDEYTWICKLGEITEENKYDPGFPLDCERFLTKDIPFTTKCIGTRDYTHPLECRGVSYTY